MSDRYFPATALGGRLYLDEEAYCDEPIVDMLVLRVGHRKVRTGAELLSVVRESDRGLPTIRVWVHEELRTLARRLWKEVPVG